MIIDLINFRVAGTYYNCDEEIINSLTEEFENYTLELTVQSEPDNEHDTNAVGIFYNDVKIGYVPKTLSELVTNILLQDVKVCCLVTSVMVKDMKVFVTLYLDL